MQDGTHRLARMAAAADVRLPPTPDFDHYPVIHSPRAVEVEPTGIIVVWSDGREDRFNRFWLRENTVASGIVDPATREREIDVADLPGTLAAAAVEIIEGGAIAVTWQPDMVRSEYHPGWLRAMAEHKWHPETDVPPRQTWDAAAMPEPPTFDGPEVLSDAAAQQAWLTALEAYGLARLRNLPVEDGVVQTVAERIGTIRPTNFGFLFRVASKPDPDSTAYTAVGLAPHTDLPTRETQPGLQLLFCKQNTATGGESLMVDGLRAAEVLALRDPGTYRALTTQRWLFSNRHRDTDYRRCEPIIGCDSHGDPTEVRLANFLRAQPDVPANEVEDAYQAVRRFMRLIQSPELVCRYPFAAGDLIAFDNRRILHGRDAFDPNSGARELEGCYLDRDELHSRLRVLARQQRAKVANTPAALGSTAGL